MAKGKVRTAVVDGVAYRWSVRELDHPAVAVRIWDAAGGHGGRPLEVVVDLFSPAPGDGNAGLPRFDTITPSRIPGFVDMGLRAGWSPGSRGAPFTIDTRVAFR